MDVKWVVFVAVSFLVAVTLLTIGYDGESTHNLINLDAQHNSFAIRG